MRYNKYRPTLPGIHIDINICFHCIEREPGIRDLPGSCSRYTPGGTGIPDLPGSCSARDIPGSQYENKSAPSIASARYNCPVYRECAVGVLAG